jgi:hypothetical protein
MKLVYVKPQMQTRPTIVLVPKPQNNAGNYGSTSGSTGSSGYGSPNPVQLPWLKPIEGDQGSTLDVSKAKNGKITISVDHVHRK